MDTGSVDLTAVAKLLASYSSISYRFLAQEVEGTFQITRLIIGASPASWKSYTYDSAIFVAGTERGNIVSDWLINSQVTTRYHQTYPLLPTQAPAYYVRRPSHTSQDLFNLAKPYTFYRVGFSKSGTGRDSILASERAPFFLNVQEAERTLIYGRGPGEILSGNQQTPEHGISIYMENSEAWLEKIRFSSSSIEITLNGDALTEVRLKVTGTGIEEYDNCPSEKIVTLAAPSGPPDVIKIALLKGSTWLDYYYDNVRTRYYPFAQKHANVVFDYQEPEEEIKRLILSGEGKTTEFKSEESEDIKKWTKTVVAFANTEGGYIIFGVNNEGSVVGLKKELAKHNGSIASFKDELTNTIANTVSPVPDYEILPSIKIDWKDILVIKVMSSSEVYSLTTTSGNPPAFYIRRDATSRVANSFEVQELVRWKDSRKIQRTNTNIL